MAFFSFKIASASLTALALLSSGQPSFAQYDTEFAHAIRARRELFGERQQPDKALATVNQLIKTKPTWEAFYRRAVLRYRRNEFAAAAEDCEQSLKLQKSQAVYYLLCGARLLQGPSGWSKGLLATESLERTNPEAIFAHELGALLAALCGDFERSLDHLAAYDAQVGLGGHNQYKHPAPGFIGRLSDDGVDRIMAKLGNSEGKTRRKLLSALASFLRFQYTRSAASLNEIDRDKTRKHKNKGEENLALALCICNQQMLAEPAAIEEKALNLVHQTNEHQAALSILDTTYFVLDQRDKSLSFLNHLIERESAIANKSKSQAEIIELLYARANVNEQLKEVKAALQDCQAILKSDPAQKKARLNACRYKLMLGENDGVLADLNSYIKSYPADGSANFLRAQILVVNKNWQPAIRDLTVAINDGYYLLKSLQARAACYRAMHQDKLAADDVSLASTFKIDNAAVVTLAIPAH